MHIKMVDRGTECELLLEGSLDSSNADDVEGIILDMARQKECLVLNMSRLEYISSAGLRIIKLVYMTMRKKHGELIMKNVGSSVMEIFEITGFAGLLKFE